MIGGLGMQELIIILFIALIMFGGKRLPEIGKSLGKAIRGFKEGSEQESEAHRRLREEAEPAEEASTEEGSPPEDKAAEHGTGAPEEPQTPGNAAK